MCVCVCVCVVHQIMLILSKDLARGTTVSFKEINNERSCPVPENCDHVFMAAVLRTFSLSVF